MSQCIEAARPLRLGRISSKPREFLIPTMSLVLTKIPGAGVDISPSQTSRSRLAPLVKYAATVCNGVIQVPWIESRQMDVLVLSLQTQGAPASLHASDQLYPVGSCMLRGTRPYRPSRHPSENSHCKLQDPECWHCCEVDRGIRDP